MKKQCYYEKFHSHNICKHMCIVCIVFLQQVISLNVLYKMLTATLPSQTITFS